MTDEEIRGLIKSGDLHKWTSDGLGWLLHQTEDDELIRKIREYRIGATHREEGFAGIL